MNIVSIGGGDLADGETLPLDRFVVDLTGTSRPHALFIPTASGDAPKYCKTFDDVYGARLGCTIDHLLLINRSTSVEELRERILGADLIYVGGGNSLRMLKLWRRRGVDEILREAWNRGVVLSGLSAGAICWHQYGHSDSLSFSASGDWKYIRVRGLGLVPGTFCPHLDAEERHESFQEMIMKRGGLGIACDNRAAVWYHGTDAIVKTAAPTAGVTIYRRHRIDPRESDRSRRYRLSEDRHTRDGEAIF